MPTVDADWRHLLATVLARGVAVDRRRGRERRVDGDGEGLRTRQRAVAGLRGDGVGVAGRGLEVDLGAESATVTTPVAALMVKPPPEVSPVSE